MNKVAVIDMGSNSIRLLLAQIENGALVSAQKMLSMTRLSAGLEKTGQLGETAIQDSIEAIKAFKALADGGGYLTLGAFATSAVREAGNGREFAARIERETGVSVEIISGETEAELGFKGVLAGLSSPGRVLVIDIGGGSAEVILGDFSGIAHRYSFPLGAVRLTERWLKSDPPSPEALKALSENVSSLLSELHDVISDFEPEIAVGIGGTATTLGAIELGMEVYDREKIQGFQVDWAMLSALCDTLSKMDLVSRKRIPGLQPKRADIIVAGAHILREMLETFGMNGFVVSDSDNLEGLLVARGLLKM